MSAFRPHDVFACSNGQHARKLLFYISSMLAFRITTSRGRIDKPKLYEKLSRVPTVVVDGLVARFTETSRGSSTSVIYPQRPMFPPLTGLSFFSLIDRSQVTTQTQTNLLTYLFALCLRVDRYSTDTSIIAADLSMSVPMYVFSFVDICVD